MRNLRRWTAIVLWSWMFVSSFLDLETPGDYTVFVAFGDAALAGDVPYPDPDAVRAGEDEGRWATWPPGFVPLAAVLAKLDAVAHAPTVVAFQLLNLGMLVLALWVFVPWLTGRRFEWDAPIVVVALLVPFRLVLSNFELAQVNLVVLGLVVSGMCLLRRRPLAGGLMFGLGSAIKATPILLVGYLAWRGRTRAAIAAIAGCAVAWFALPAFVLGPAEAVEWWRAWFAALPSAGDQPGWMNQSLRAVATRAFGAGAGDAAWLVGTLLLGAALLGALGRPFRDVDSRRVAAEVAVLLAALTIVSPVSWKAHYVTLVPLCALLWAASRDAVDRPSAPKSRGRFRAIALGALVASGAALTLSSRELIGRAASVRLETLGLVVFVALGLVGVGAVLVWRNPGESRPDQLEAEG